MNQFQFEMIAKIIESGAPALAGELIGALDALVKERNHLAAIAGEFLKEEKSEEDNQELPQSEKSPFDKAREGNED